MTTTTGLIAAGLMSASSLIVAAAVVVPAQTGQPPIVQLCAATGVTEVDTILGGLADTDLVGALEPLVGLTVPDDDALRLAADVDLDQVRDALDCDGDDPDPTTTPTPTGTPAPTTSTPRPTATVIVPTPDRDDDESGFGQVDRVPSGSVATGGGPVEP